MRLPLSGFHRAALSSQPRRRSRSSRSSRAFSAAIPKKSWRSWRSSAERIPPTSPTITLSILGTHPDHRGHGIGMALVADTLERIDQEHAAAYLESSNPANDARYESVGFVRIGEFAAPGGPSVATMWRDPR